MPLPDSIEGRVASLSDLMDSEVDIGSGTISIDVIRVNNRVLYVGKQDDVSNETLTTIVTLPANGVKYITKIVCSGQDNARWEIYVDNNFKCLKRTTDRNVEFDFPIPWKILTAEVVDIKSIFWGSGSTADLSATIWGYEVEEDITAPAAISGMTADVPPGAITSLVTG